ncbi:hypothetical protein LC55x_1849 [Lysobacter capsici]|nr:hypothetical protein LC55x_1849 [Lysobacter capsici]
MIRKGESPWRSFQKEAAFMGTTVLVVSTEPRVCRAADLSRYMSIVRARRMG